MPSEEEHGTGVEAIVIFYSRASHYRVGSEPSAYSHILNTILLFNPEDNSIVSQMKIKDLGCCYAHLSQSLQEKCSYFDPRFRGSIRDVDRVVAAHGETMNQATT